MIKSKTIWWRFDNPNHDPRTGEFTSSESGLAEGNPLSRGEKDFVDNFDHDEPQTWELGEEKTSLAEAAKEKIESDEMSASDFDSSNYPEEIVDGAKHENERDEAESNLDGFDKNDITTWGLDQQREGELMGKDEDVEGLDASDAGGWDTANDARIKELGEKWNDTEEAQQGKFEKEHEPEVKQRLKAMKDELKDEAKKSKENLQDKYDLAKKSVEDDQNKSLELDRKSRANAKQKYRSLQQEAKKKFSELYMRDDHER